jgi:hypothetical protein
MFQLFLSARANNHFKARSAGRDIGEYLTRNPEDNHRQSSLNTEIANGRRLNELGATIGHFQFLKTAQGSRLQSFDNGSRTKN